MVMDYLSKSTAEVREAVLGGNAQCFWRLQS